MGSDLPQLPAALPRGKPWLYPYNRRVRHLNGLAIRNLSSSDHSLRKRGESVDDEALPQSLQSPAKLLTQQEVRTLEHSRSSTDLKYQPIKEDQAREDGSSHLQTPKRPKARRLRRRSTLDWANSSPSVRQRRLEEDAKARMMDVFFSIHVLGVENPVYISETIKETMNPTFRLFTLENEFAFISRQDTITLKIWTKSGDRAETIMHMELELTLRYLKYVGKSLDDLRGVLPRNCVFFTLADGVYTIPTSGLGSDDPFTVDSPTFPPSKVQFTSSYDALMRLSTLDACIQDALATRARVEAEINNLLEQNQASLAQVRNVESAQESSSAVISAVGVEKKRLETAKRRRDALRAAIADRESFIQNSQLIQAKEQDLMRHGEPALKEKAEELSRIADQAHGQRRRICEDILQIYPIEPLPGRALAFTIRGLHLPNANDLDDADDLMLSAALGFVAQVVYMLSSYLSKPLPYSLTARGSSSTIVDQLSASTGESVYPLFSRGVARFRFEYAVFLLNKNIEVLSNHVGLKVMDTRHTLPNLTYLLYIATAGSGELPSRKAGGIRAFLRASKGGGSGVSSRRGSDSSSVGDTALKEGKANGSALHAPVKFGKYKPSNLRDSG